jgi:hypothetical protein
MRTNKAPEYITFTKEQYLSFEEFEQYIDNDPLSAVELIANRLQNYILIVDNVLYLYDDVTVTYKVIKQNDKLYLTTIARKLIVDSYRRFTDKEQRRLQKMYTLNTIFSLEYQDTYFLDLYYLLTNDSIVFTTSNKKVTHYRNGYLSNKTGKFSTRDPNKHYVKDFYDEDYLVPKNEEEEYDIEVNVVEDYTSDVESLVNSLN